MYTKKAVILVNVGTPDKPEVKYVRKYLFEFLNDRRVIDIPWILQKILVNFIIVPFRAPKSTILYKLLWTDKGSPLKCYQEQVVEKLQKIMGDEFVVYSAMRYGNPNLRIVLNEIKEKKFNEIILVPLYPQYASSTTGSVNQLFMEEIKKWIIIPQLRFIDQFYDHPSFIGSFAERASAYKPEEYDHIIFSYHGLPDRQIMKTHPEISMKNCNCVNEMPEHGKYCYRATCYETTRILAKRLNISKDRYTVAFQSRLSNNWLSPFINEVIEEKAKKGIKKILVFAPAFVTDCLETIVEIKHEYGRLFKNHGGEKLEMVESLNDMDSWVEGLSKIIGAEIRK